MCFVATKSIFILVCGIFILPTKSIFWLVSTQVFNKVNFYPHSREPIIWWVFGQPITEFNNFPYGCAQPQCFPHTPLTISETTAHQTSVYLTITSEKHAHQSIRLVTTHISQHCQNVKKWYFTVGEMYLAETEHRLTHLFQFQEHFLLGFAQVL